MHNGIRIRRGGQRAKSQRYSRRTSQIAKGVFGKGKHNNLHRLEFDKSLAGVEGAAHEPPVTPSA